MITFVEAEIALRLYNDQYCYDGDTCYVTVDGKKIYTAEGLKVGLIK